MLVTFFLRTYSPAHRSVFSFPAKLLPFVNLDGNFFSFTGIFFKIFAGNLQFQGTTKIRINKTPYIVILMFNIFREVSANENLVCEYLQLHRLCFSSIFSFKLFTDKKIHGEK